MKRLVSIIVAVMLASMLCLTGCLDEGGTSTSNKQDKLALNVATVEMQQYEEETLTANKEGVSWTSSDPRTVRVEDGKLTSLKLGSATVTATLGEETATCEVTVIPATKGRALIVDTESVKLKAGETATVTATLKEDGTPLDVQMTWTFDKEGVATVENGVITAVGRGTAILTVSTTYKGQTFTKEVTVVVSNYVDLKWEQNETHTALTAYTGDVTQIGFVEGTTVYQWDVTNDGWGSRVWDPAITPEVAEHELLVTKIRFTSNKIGDIMLWLQDGVVKFGHDFIGEGLTHGVSDNQSIACLYDANGKAVSPTNAYYINAETTYTLVIDITGLNSTSGAFGIGIFGGPTTVYLADAIACSKAYATETFTNLDLPKYPTYENLYIAKESGTDIVAVTLETEGDWAGWYKQDFVDDFWGARLHVGRSDITTSFVVNSKYSEYDYFGFDVVFTSVDFVNLVVWNGSLNAVFAYVDGSLAAQGGATVNADDFIVLKNGVDVTGEAYEANVVYTFKIKIQKSADPYGFAVNRGESTGSMYVSKPYFI